MKLDNEDKMLIGAGVLAVGVLGFFWWKNKKKQQEALQPVETPIIETPAIPEMATPSFTPPKVVSLDRDKILEMQSNLVKLAYNKMVKTKEPSPSDLQAYNATIERYSKLLGLDAPKQIEQKTTLIGLDSEFVD